MAAKRKRKPRPKARPEPKPEPEARPCPNRGGPERCELEICDGCRFQERG